MLETLLTGEISQTEYFNLYDVTLLYKELPKKIYGFIFRYKGKNIITINSYISETKKKMTILHELAHLELSHLDNKKKLMEFKIENIEDDADKYIDFILNSIGGDFIYE